MGLTRIQTVALAGLFSAGVGVLAVQTSPTCQRIVRNYVMVPVRNRVSKATDLAWAKWRVEHPNWKPKPGVTRPKYVMTRKETMDKVDIACEVPNVPSTSNLFFTPTDFGPPPVIAVPPDETTQIDFPDLIPPVVAEIPPVTEDTTGTPIYIPPIIPPPGGQISVPVYPGAPVPEPASFFLVVLGMTGGWLAWMRRERSGRMRARFPFAG